VIVRVLSPRVLTSRISGHLDKARALELISHLDAWRKLHGSDLVALHDLYDLEDYDSDARSVVTQWSKAHRNEFRSVHLLLRSRAVAWGVRIINGLIGNLIVVHQSRPPFEAAELAAWRT
jgi:hypothetical protein